MIAYLLKEVNMNSMEIVESTISNAIDHPDMPLTHTGLNIPREQLERATPSKMYADGGRKLKVTNDICNRGMTVDFPTSHKQVFQYYNEFIRYCYDYQIPPTFSLFSMWCGTTVNGYNKYMKQARGSSLGDALEECKESVRSFIELAAMEGDVDKLIYFHQQKGYFDVVEKVEVKHEVEQVSEEMSPAQIDAVINALPPIEMEVVD